MALPNLGFSANAHGESGGGNVFNAGSVFGNASASTALPDAVVNAAVSQSNGSAKWYWILAAAAGLFLLALVLKRKFAK